MRLGMGTDTLRLSATIDCEAGIVDRTQEIPACNRMSRASGRTVPKSCPEKREPSTVKARLSIRTGRGSDIETETESIRKRYLWGCIYRPHQ